MTVKCYWDRVAELDSEQLYRHFGDLYGLAYAYLDDGAPSTCAERLREAADVADEIARRREVALNALSGGE